MSFWNRIKEIAAVANVRKPVPNAVPAREVSPPARPIQAPILPSGNPIPVAAAVTLPPVTPRKTSKAGIDLMHQFEGCEKKRPDGRFEAYLCPAGVWTIGWGSTGTDPFNGGKIGRGTVWTREQCDLRFEMHLATFEQGVRDAIGKAPTSQPQFDAMVCLAYNIGVGAFQRSTVLRKHNAGDFPAAAKAFLMWSKAGGKTLRGLVRRREAEAALYRGDA